MPKPGPRTTNKYSDEFKATAVRLSQLPGVEVQDVAASLYIYPFMLSCWRIAPAICPPLSVAADRRRWVPCAGSERILKHMTKSAEDIVDSAKKLLPVVRAAVIEALLKSMDASDLSLDAKWAAEAESRLEAYVAGEFDSVEADEVFAQIRK